MTILSDITNRPSCHLTAQGALKPQATIKQASPKKLDKEESNTSEDQDIYAIAYLALEEIEELFGKQKADDIFFSVCKIDPRSSPSDKLDNIFTAEVALKIIHKCTLIEESPKKKLFF